VTGDERREILAKLRAEALADLAGAGCTCIPTLALSEKLYGPHKLPMWESDHDDDCGLVRTAQASNPEAEKALIVSSSIARRLAEDA
jgi:hypothetical protein